MKSLINLCSHSPVIFDKSSSWEYLNNILGSVLGTYFCPLVSTLVFYTHLGQAALEPDVVHMISTFRYVETFESATGQFINQ